MKRKAFVFVISLLLSGMAFAQDLHWGDFDYHQYEDFFTVNGKVFFDDELQNRPNIEVAGFVDGELRGSFFLNEPYPNTSYAGYYVWSTYYFNTKNETFTFKAYDHDNDIEYDLCDVELIGQSKVTYGSVREPILMHFTQSTGYTKTITGYGESTGGYVLIASPIDGMAPADVTCMVTEEATEYDLYAFEQNPTDGDEWRNFKKAGEFTTLESGKGYLYARKVTADLVFTGNPYEGGGVFGLDFVAGSAFEGMNLVGNPFTEDAYVGVPFYTLNAEGEFVTNAADAAIPAMEGVFVCANGTGESVTFTTEAGKKASHLALDLVNGNKLVDRAIVNFDETQQLPKFQLNANSTKLYFPMSDKDYAVVSSQDMGELPLNFKAEKNGHYTLAINSEEVSFGYLHLIDNLTGTDIDLLANPSYSFDTRSTDYASRFKLVFATGSTTGSEAFAFYSNGSFVINNEGNATLQMVDVTGRIISTETINGCANVNAAPGAYMLRLINGDSERVQKVVVE